ACEAHDAIDGDLASRSRARPPRAAERHSPDDSRRQEAWAHRHDAVPLCEGRLDRQSLLREPSNLLFQGQGWVARRAPAVVTLSPGEEMSTPPLATVELEGGVWSQMSPAANVVAVPPWMKRSAFALHERRLFPTLLEPPPPRSTEPADASCTPNIAFDVKTLFSTRAATLAPATESPLWALLEMVFRA